MPASSLPDLRRHLAEAALRSGPAAAGRVSFGLPALDEPLGGGLARAALHEIQAPGTADLAAATGFALGLALRAAGERAILWARQDIVEAEAGRPHAPGLVELGLDPDRLLLVRARDPGGVLRAGAEAARCSALGAVLIEFWGEPRVFDLTASRRLALAAESSGVTTLLLRAAASPAPNAARTRWQVTPQPSRALEANAPGAPAFNIRLLRHRGGLGEREWRVEWNRDRRSFQDSPVFVRSEQQAPRTAHGPPLSRPLVSLPGDRPAQAGEAGLRRTG